MKKIIDKENLVTFKIWPENSAVVGFYVYRISGFSDGDPEYGNYNEGIIRDTDKAPVFMSGMIKFDGCINYEFPDSANCMIHDCNNPGSLFKLIFDTIYRTALEYMPESEQYLCEK